MKFAHIIQTQIYVENLNCPFNHMFFVAVNVQIDRMSLGLLVRFVF